MQLREAIKAQGYGANPATAVRATAAGKVSTTARDAELAKGEARRHRSDKLNNI